MSVRLTYVSLTNLASVSVANFRTLREAGIVMDMAQQHADQARRKGAYHHGELRDALVRATRQLVEERGAENFTLADACRIAGVSTAAPYNHFRDKNEILQELIVQGFDQMAAERRAAVERFDKGSLEGIVAMGQSYIEFAMRETGMFRLMFGQNPILKSAANVQDRGRACFSGVIEDVATFCSVNGVKEDAGAIALSLWTFVHGAASLLIDEDYEKVAPGLDVNALVARAAPRLLGLG
jgi:AcrR family transcriptional regulator